jgi:hypothetical protein
LENNISFWKSKLEDIEEIVKEVKVCEASVLGYSAGGRKIWMIEYGEKENFNRKANYSSACGAKSTSYYAEKSSSNKPVILLVGAVHGGEMEGIAGLLNLIHVIEKGTDLRGKKWSYISENISRFRLVIIPCMNPDGRARLDFDNFIGMTHEQLKYYMQGTWRDGSLCDWPACKAVHPILKDVDYLGAYFNDNGINLMHDNFFNPMAEETKLLLQLADREAVDFSVLLHGGASSINHITPTTYIPFYMKLAMKELDSRIYSHCTELGLRFNMPEKTKLDGECCPPPSFNLTSAIHHVCGALSILYESNMGLDDSNLDHKNYSADEILDSHMVLFEEIFFHSLNVN